MRPKSCSSCKLEKAISSFHKKAGGLHGVDSKCKQCVSQSKRKYYNKKRRAKKGVIEIIDDSVGLPENALSLFAKLLEML